MHNTWDGNTPPHKQKKKNIHKPTLQAHIHKPIPQAHYKPHKQTNKHTLQAIISSDRSAMPISLMQWWMRPGPRRPWAISKPRPSPRRRLLAGTLTSLNSISA